MYFVFVRLILKLLNSKASHISQVSHSWYLSIYPRTIYYLQITYNNIWYIIFKSLGNMLWAFIFRFDFYQNPYVLLWQSHVNVNDHKRPYKYFLSLKPPWCEGETIVCYFYQYITKISFAQAYRISITQQKLGRAHLDEWWPREAWRKKDIDTDLDGVT